MCSLEILIQLVSTNVLINLWWQCKVSKQLCMYPEQRYSLCETGPVCRYCCLKSSPVFFLILTAIHAEIDSMDLQSLLHTPFFKENRIQSSVYSSQCFLLGQKIQSCHDLCQCGCEPHMMRLKPILFFSMSVLWLICGFMTK